MPYCPNCRADFVEGVTHCSDCGAELKAGSLADMAAAIEDPNHPNLEFVLLAESQGEVLTRIIQAELEAAAIPCVLSGDAQGAIKIYEPKDSKIWVPKRNLERAERIFEEVLASPPLDDVPTSDEAAYCDSCGAEVPPDAAICPECGVTFESVGSEEAD